MAARMLTRRGDRALETADLPQSPAVKYLVTPIRPTCILLSKTPLELSVPPFTSCSVELLNELPQQLEEFCCIPLPDCAKRLLPLAETVCSPKSV
jgi:hypothetical protein